MRICFIASADSIHTQRWINYLSSRDHEVHLIFTKFTLGYDRYDRKVIMHPLVRLMPRIWKITRYLSGILWFIQTRRIVQQIKPDILDAHYIKTNGYLGAFSGFHPLILTVWGSDILITPVKSRIHRIFTMYALKKADLVVGLSSTLSEEIAKIGIKKDKVQTALIGVDTRRFTRSYKEKMPIKDSLGIPKSSPVVISTRALNPIYDVETLIQAIPLVIAEIPEVTLIIIGDGSQRTYLRGMIDSYNIRDKVRFIGKIPHEEMHKYLSLADVYVSTSLSDGASNSLLEAMSCGIPSVVTDIPANRSWIVNEKNGFLFHKKDYKDLAIKIIHLLRNKVIAEHYGELSKKLIYDRADYYKNMAIIESRYKEIISQSNRANR